MEWLLEPLNYEFMRYSLAMGIIVGFLCPGMYLSYYFDLPSGPAIAIVVFGLFLLAPLSNPSQGLSILKRLGKIYRDLPPASCERKGF